MTIDIESQEYQCWHEAGHAVLCLVLGGKVELMEIIRDEEHFGRARARCETTEATRRYIACGGFAAEYMLCINKMLDVSEDQFVQIALVNAFPDKAMFFGADHVQANNAWPSAMDERFMHFSIKYVAPVLLRNCALLEELAEALLREDHLAERDINEIALKYRI